MKNTDKPFLKTAFLVLTVLMAAAAASIIAVSILNEGKINVAAIRFFAFVVFIVGIVSAFFLMKKLFFRERIQPHKTWQIEAVGHLTDSFSHKYSNVLAAILGAAEVLWHVVPDTQKEYVNIIIKNTKDAESLNNQLFGLGKRKKKEIISIDMHELLNSVIEILKKNTTANIKYFKEFNAKMWNITGDTAQLKNSFLNLGFNVIKSIGSDEGSISFKTETTEFQTKTNIGIFSILPGKYLTIFIEDTGNEFPYSEMEKIFNRYFVEQKENEKFDSNISVSAILAAVGHHNGAIFAQRKEHHGSIFTIYLPLSNPKADEHKIGYNEKIYTSDGLVIMVVDDNPSVSKIVKAMLNRMGYPVITAESGFDAIEIFKDMSDKIALVILDMVMPNMDGVSCFYELKKIKNDIKVLVSSGLIDNSSIEDMERDGLCGFIKKPYSYYELEKAIVNTLQL